MEILYIEPTSTTPLVHFDKQIGLLDLRGRSSPENSVSFYSNILEHIDHYCKVGSVLTANFSFEYFNTSSLKNIFVLLQRIVKFWKAGGSVEVNWYYEEDDEDMFEAGEDLNEILGLPFNFKEIQYQIA